VGALRMPFRVVVTEGVPEVDDDDTPERATPILDKLLEIDDPDKRRVELLRALVFKRLDVQVELNVATTDLMDPDERCDYAQEIRGLAYLDRSTIQMLWDVARAARREAKAARENDACSPKTRPAA